MRFSGGGFSRGFTSGWGLADSYLNRQEDRKRQAFEDRRQAEETRYQRGRDRQVDAENQKRYEYGVDLAKTALTRKNLLEEYKDVQAGVIRDETEERQWKEDDLEAAALIRKTERENASDKLSKQKAQQEAEVHKRVIAADNEKTANAAHAKQFETLRRTYEAWDKKSAPPQELIDALRDSNLMTKLDIEDPGLAVEMYNVLEGAVENGTFGEKEIDAANKVFGELINKRDPLIHEDRSVMGIVSGKSMKVENIIVPQGSKITNREIIGVTPLDKGQGFVLKMRVQATGKDGQVYEYTADSMKKGAADNTSSPQIFTFEQLMAISQQKKAMIAEIQSGYKRAESVSRSNWLVHPDGEAWQASEKLRLQEADNKRKARDAAIKRTNAWVNQMIPASTYENDPYKVGLKRTTLINSYEHAKAMIYQKWGDAVMKDGRIVEMHELEPRLLSPILSSFETVWKMAEDGQYSMSIDQYLGKLEKEIGEQTAGGVAKPGTVAEIQRTLDKPRGLSATQQSDNRFNSTKTKLYQQLSGGDAQRLRDSKDDPKSLYNRI
jgi:hypothetical protein